MKRARTSTPADREALRRLFVRIARAEGRLPFDEPSFPADICHEDGLRYPITIRVF